MNGCSKLFMWWECKDPPPPYLNINGLPEMACELPLPMPRLPAMCICLSCNIERVSRQGKTGKHRTTIVSGNQCQVACYQRDVADLFLYKNQILTSQTLFLFSSISDFLHAIEGVFLLFYNVHLQQL